MLRGAHKRSPISHNHTTMNYLCGERNIYIFLWLRVFCFEFPIWFQKSTFYVTCVRRPFVQHFCCVEPMCNKIQIIAHRLTWSNGKIIINKSGYQMRRWLHNWFMSVDDFGTSLCAPCELSHSSLGCLIFRNSDNRNGRCRRGNFIAFPFSKPCTDLIFHRSHWRHQHRVNFTNGFPFVTNQVKRH